MATVPPFSSIPIPPAPPRTEPRTVVIETQVVPLFDDDRPGLEELVELARLERELLRAELRRHLAVVRLDVPTEPWYARPWARIAAAALFGYAIGRSKALRLFA